MAKPRGTDGSLLSSLPWTLAALALAILPHIQFLPAWITAAFVGCAVWRYVLERRRGALPHTWFRALLALVCFLGVLATYATISGVGPGSALLAVMASLKILETRKRRDQFVLLFIAIFLVMSSLLREQYLWSLPYMVLAFVFIMTAWLRISAEPHESLKRSSKTAGRLILYAAPLAIAMWVFFPRISTPFWAVPIDTSSGVSGLSDTMSPGDISSLSLSNAVAFRVTFDDAVPAPRDRYWRALVLYRFNGRSWSGSEPDFNRNNVERIAVAGEATQYQITMEPTRQQWVPALEAPKTWSLSRTSMTRMLTLARVYPIDQRVKFDVKSYTDYQSDTALTGLARDWFTDYSEGSNPRTVELARRMYAEAGSTGDFINAILQMFHEQEYYYTLQPPALGSNPVDRFLFDTQQGFCEHYASAFSVMMRAAGIPARVVLGYQGGEINPIGEHLTVRQSDAHAWAEVWFPGAGWKRVDPTAAVAPERIELGMADSLFDGLGLEWGMSTPSKLLHQMLLSWDALNAGWNDWVLGYGPDRQNSLMQYFGMDDPSWRNKMLTLIALIVMLTLIVSSVLAWRYRPPPKDRAAILYQRFVRRAGVQPRIGETPDVYAARASAESSLGEETIHAITDTYLAARYGGVDPNALQRLERAVAAIR